MEIEITNCVFEKTGWSERDFKIEFACYLFDRGVLALWPAAQLVEMERVEFEAELAKRKIPIYRPTVEEFEK